MPAGTSATSMLDAVYRDLDYATDQLRNAVERPEPDHLASWAAEGEWLSQAAEAGAERVFFVSGSPVVVFAKIDSQSSSDLRSLIDRIWCMSRPSLLFVASPGELRVINLSGPPNLAATSIDEDDRLLKTITDIRDVQRKLQVYHRRRVESGRVFEDARFDRRYRADHSLIRDIRFVREKLVGEGLPAPYANALLGRSIFIRYLEDRGILTRQYYEQVASAKSTWRTVLGDIPDRPSIGAKAHSALLPRVLRCKEFTYALFAQLARDFNGDLFPSTPDECAQVRHTHLTSIADLLIGNVDAHEQLFFTIYEFDVIPVELISCIYEEFYKSGLKTDDSDGTHYTPIALVEYLLHECTAAIDLAQDKPRFIDPACGSGVFLVAAFRRVVHARSAHLGRRLGPQELRVILRDQICGIDLNEGAVTVAAFSLYLALLHYQRPRDIVDQMYAGRTLPSLIHGKNHSNTDCFNILYTGDAFEVADGSDPKSVVPEHSFDVVIGNPPWGGKDTTLASKTWAEERGRPVGGAERSQLFVWLAIALAKPDGVIGLLLAKSILLNHRSGTVEFRSQWLSTVRLSHVADFSHVRAVFFSQPHRQSKAIHPFIAAVFSPTKNLASHKFEYLSAKRRAMVDRLQAVVFTRNDIHWLVQDHHCTDFRFWKCFWWGSHHDYNLMRRLDFEDRLSNLLASSSDLDRGFQRGSGWPPAPELSTYQVLEKHKFTRYGPLVDDQLSPPCPAGTKARLTSHLYDGLRILFGRSPKQKDKSHGMLLARLEDKRFAFPDDILGIKLGGADESTYKIVLGILWSSFARYYLWFASSMWGMRNDKIHKTELKNVPIRIPPQGSSLHQRIVDVVDCLRQQHFVAGMSMFADESVGTVEERTALECELDSAIYELFECSNGEREQIHDLCNFDLPFFYDSSQSDAASTNRWPTKVATEGRVRDLPTTGDYVSCPLIQYVRVFATYWNDTLKSDGGELAYQILASPGDAGMMAVVFKSISRTKRPSIQSAVQQQTWNRLLSDIGRSSICQAAPSMVYLQGLVRYVSPHRIVIIKKDERRLWTRSAARVDAEATIAQTLSTSGE